MIYHFFNLLIRRTHFWRSIGYSELAELYVSRMLRVMALQMIGGFAAVFMYQLGYSLQQIAIYFFFYFLLRVLMTPLVAAIVARYGPKHGTLISNIGQIVGTVLLVLLPELGLVSLILFAPIAGLSRSLYDVCYLVDFSKIKHVDHAGKELGLMQIFEKIMMSLGPVVGGVIALLFGAQAMFVFGAVLLLIAALPLFFTPEPVKVHQKITLKHFNWRVAWRPSLAHVGVGIDVNLTGFVWNLFIVIIVLGVTTNEIYVQIGALSSVSILASIVSAYYFGKIVDKHQGKFILKIGVIGVILTHLVRPFVRTPVQVVGLNVANDITTTAYTLPMVRGMFDTADGLPGYRIVYFSILEAASVFGDALVMAALVGLTTFLNEKQSLEWIYFSMAPFLLLILFHARAVYRRGVLTKFIHRV